MSLTILTIYDSPRGQIEMICADVDEAHAIAETVHEVRTDRKQTNYAVNASYVLTPDVSPWRRRRGSKIDGFTPGPVA